MIISTITASNCTPQTIVIGRRGTYDTIQIAFDLSYLIESYGSGTAVLAVKRSQDESAYPAVVTQEDNTLTWTVSETDTYYVGSGECQLMWYVDGGLAKTIIYPMVVMRDILSTSEEPPDGYENWIEHLTDLGAETQQNAQNAAQSASEAEQAKDDAVDAKEASEEAARKAVEASVHAPIIQNGFWYIWSDDQYVNTNVRAEGEKGDKGDTGEKGDTGNGIASITKTGTSGLVDTYTVTYTDGTTTTFTVTNGAKGDKGDTGATGNGIQSITKTGTSGNVDTYTITYTNGQTTTFTVTNGAVTSVAGKTGAVVLDSGDIEYDSTETYTSGTVGAELDALSRQLNDSTTGLDTKAPVILETASGAIASFSDGADSMPIRKIVGTIVPVQAGTGDPSPDNVRPISGWTGVNIFATEKNMMECTSDNMIGTGVTVDNGVLTTSFHTVTEAGIVFPVKPNTRYIVGFTKLSGGPMYVRCAEYSKKPTSYGSDRIREIIHSENTVESDAKNTITTGPNAQYVFYGFYRSYNANAQSVDKWFANLESAGNAYEPYTGETLPINWETEAGTIYGGTVTLNEDGSADLVSTHVTYNIQPSQWTWMSSSHCFKIDRTSLSPRYKVFGSNVDSRVADIASNKYKPNTFNNIANNNNNSNYSVGIREYNAQWLALRTNGTNSILPEECQIKLPLATPITRHISDAGQLKTFLGTNNVWCDTGDITELVYPADTKLYIDGLTKPDEDMIANANIASGKYFVVNNQLYLSTAAIAAGASIVPGTNCTATNLAEALNALNT